MCHRLTGDLQPDDELELAAAHYKEAEKLLSMLTLQNPTVDEYRIELARVLPHSRR